MRNILFTALGFLLAVSVAFTTQKVAIAPPTSHIVYSALKDSPMFDREFKTIVSQIAADNYNADWSAGSQSPNSTEGRRLAFSRLILENDKATIERVKNYLLQTSFSYDFNSADNIFREQLRDNFSSSYTSLAGAY